VDRRNGDWDNIDWESIDWRNVDWENIAWDNIDWDGIDLRDIVLGNIDRDDKNAQPRLVDVDGKDICKSRRWDALGFRNQGQCVAYINSLADHLDRFQFAAPSDD
jgi:hypothetical protein